MRFSSAASKVNVTLVLKTGDINIITSNESTNMLITVDGLLRKFFSDFRDVPQPSEHIR
jgi:hypothetical protein